MAMIGKAFDSSKYDDMANFEPIPVGEYLVQVTKSDVKDTKDKTGKYIALEYTVMNGQYKGRKIWTNLNIVNKNPVAVEIAEKELATLCRSIGKGVIQDTQQLHGIPFLLKVKIKVDAKGVYPPKNEPIGYKPATASGSTPSPDFVDEPVANSIEPTQQDTTEPVADGIPWGE